MVKSMTGFGSSECILEGGDSLSVEISSANHRFFKMDQKIPFSLSSFGKEIENLIRKKVKRGSVSLKINGRLPMGESFRVNLSQLEKYLSWIQKIQKRFDLQKELDPVLILALPGVIQEVEEGTVRYEEWSLLLKALQSAVSRLDRMRVREGKVLDRELAHRLRRIERIHARILKRAPKVVQKYQMRLCKRINELMRMNSHPVEEKDLAREIAIVADRTDITEELVRLKSHVQQFESALSTEESVGKKLDFISQEMLREANTIGSKASDEWISGRVIELKTEIEKIKEQVQNVE